MDEELWTMRLAIQGLTAPRLWFIVRSGQYSEIADDGSGVIAQKRGTLMSSSRFASSGQIWFAARRIGLVGAGCKRASRAEKSEVCMVLYGGFGRVIA